MKTCCLLIGFLYLLGCTSQAQISACTITGKVTDSESGEALALVNVGEPDRALGAVTAEDGSFRIESVGSGTHIIRVALIGYFALKDTIYVRATDRIIERNYALTPYRPTITSTKEIEAYHEHLRQLSLKRPVLRIRMDSLAYSDGAVSLYSTFFNESDTSIYIIKLWQCAEPKLPRPIVFDDAQHPIEPTTLSHHRPDIIDLSCDMLPRRLFDRSDLVEIMPHSTVEYRSVRYYGLNRLPTGRYSVGMRYEFFGPDSIRGMFADPTDDAVVVALRGSFDSENTIQILNKWTTIEVLGKGE